MSRSTQVGLLHARAIRVVALLGTAVLGLTCRDRSLTGPGIPASATLSVAPVFQGVAAGGPRIRLARMYAWIHQIPPGADTIRTTVDFAGDSAVLLFDVRFTGASQLFQLHLAGIDAAGDTVFRAIDSVRAFANTEAVVQNVALVYSGADAAVTGIVLSPSDTTVASGDSLRLRAAATEPAGTTATLLLGWTSRDAVALPVSDSGVVRPRRIQRDVWVVAQLANGVRDSALVRIFAPVSSVVIPRDTASLARGDTLRLSATTQDSIGQTLTGRSITWSASNASVSVDTGGLVTASLTGGSAYVVATSGTARDSTLITVLPKPVGSVVATPDSVFLLVGQTYPLSAAVLDAQGQPNPDFTAAWSTSNAAVSTVSGTGLATGVASGQAVIRATAGGRSDSVVVTVSLVAVSTVTIAPKSDTIFAGDSVTLSATLRDAGGLVLSGRAVAWTSLTPSLGSLVATGASAKFVSNAGASGVAQLVALSEGKADTASILIVVVPVATVTVTPGADTLIAGDSLDLAATTRDAGGNVLSGRTVGWTVLTPSLGSLTFSGATARFVSATGSGGVAQIVASSEGQADTATVLILPAVAFVTIAPDSAAMTVGDSLAYTATASAANESVITGRVVTWSTLNPAVATVGAGTGATIMVRGVGPGSTRVVAVIDGKSSSAAVTVDTVVPVISATVVTPSLDTLISLTETVQLSAQAFQGAAQVPGTFTWVSRSPGTVSVTSTGLVTALANGSAYVVATEAGGTRDSALIVVQQRASTVTVTPGFATRYLGTQQQYTAAALDGLGNPMPGATFAWTSSAPLIASVNGTTGLATMTGIGLDTISASSGGAVGRSVLTVRTAITRIAVTPDSVRLTSLGLTQAYTATAFDTLDAAMSGVTFAWTSTNASVASLGGITATTATATSLANGSTSVRAVAQGVTGQTSLVVDQTLASIEILPPSASIGVGGKVALTPRGRDAANQIYLKSLAVTWSSANTQIATVDATGLVTGGNTQGPVNITASTGAITSSPSVITVSNTVAQSISFGRDTLTVGRSATSSVPIYLAVPAAAPLTVNVLVRDTVAYFTAGACTSTVTVPCRVNFPAGSTTQTVTLNGRNAGVTQASATDSAGLVSNGDTVAVKVQANANLSWTGTRFVNATDQFTAQLLLSDPAPAGGLYASFTFGTAGVASASPDPVFVPAGQLAADLVVRGVAAGTTTVTPASPGVNTTSRTVTVSAAALGGGTGLEVIGEGQFQTSAYTVSVPQTMFNALPITMSWSDSTIARSEPLYTIPVSSNFVYVTVYGLARGTSTFTASSPGYTSVSRPVRVTTPALDVCCNLTSLNTTSPVQTVSVTTRDSLGSGHARINSLFVIVSSSDTGVVKVLDTLTTVIAGASSRSGIRVQPAGGGSAYVKTTAGGHVPDSVLVTVNAPKLSWSLTTNQVGLGQVETSAFYVIAPSPVAGPVTVTITHSDSSIAGVDPLVVIQTSNTLSPYLGMRGKALGRDTLIASAPGYSPDTLVAIVSTPRVDNSVGALNAVLYAADVTTTVTMRDSSGTAHPRLTPLVVTFRSSDTLVAKVDSASVVVAAGVNSNGTAKIRIMGIGSARIYTEAVGHTPDTTTVVNVSGAKLSFSPATADVLGARQRSGSFDVSISTPNSRATSVPITLTRRYPALVQIDTPVTIAALATTAYITWSGLARGADTVVASAPGYLPDTMRFVVSTARLLGSNISTTATTTSLPFTVSASSRDSLNTAHATLDTVVVRVTSSNPAVLSVDSALVRIPAGSVNTNVTTVRYVGPGAAFLIYADTAGVYLPDSSNTVTVTGPSLQVGAATNRLGMRQQTSSSEQFVSIPNALGVSLTVKLLISDTTLITAPDSIVIPAGTSTVYFTVRALDTIGTVRLTAQAPGYADDFIDYAVGRPKLQITTTTNLTVGQPITTVTVRPLDQNGTIRVSAQPVTVSLESSAPGVASLDIATVTIPAGTNINTTARVTANAPGTTVLIASDPRTALYGYLPDTIGPITVTTPKVTLSPSADNLAPGQGANWSVSIPYSRTDTLVVALTHSDATRLTTPATARINPGNTNSGVFRASALALGIDSVRAAATGYLGDTTVVTIAVGRTILSSWPASLRVGDSAAVRIQVQNNLGNGKEVDAATSFTLSPTSGIVFQQAGATVTSLVVPALATQSAIFYVKGVAAGAGTVNVANSNYVTYVNSVSVSP